MSSRKVQTLCVVDNDYDFFAQFQEQLQKDVAFGGVTCVPLLYASTISDEEMVRQILTCSPSPDLVLMDIVLKEMHGNSQLLHGLVLARELRAARPELPIAFITKHCEKEYLPVVVYASLEDVDGVFLKQYLLRNPEFCRYLALSSEDLGKLLAKAVENREVKLAQGALKADASRRERSWEMICKRLRPDARATAQMNEIGPEVVRGLFEQLFPPQVFADVYTTYFRPGFSGAYLFRVDAVNVAPPNDLLKFLVKVSRDRRSVAEAERCAVAAKCLPSVHTIPITHGAVTFGAASGFAMRLAEDVAPLRHVLVKSDEKAAIAALNRSFDALGNLYAVQAARNGRLWNEVFRISDSRWLSIEAVLADLEEVLKDLGLADVRERVGAFVGARGAGVEQLTRVSVAQWSQVHGDLHAQNVLIRSDGTPQIIDWANFSEGGVPAQDFGKLEMDLWMFVLGCCGVERYSFGRLGEWSALWRECGEAAVEGRAIVAPGVSDQERAMAALVGAVRGRYSSVVSKGVTSEGYFLALAYQALLHLSYPDVPAVKKVLAITILDWIVAELRRGGLH